MQYNLTKPPLLKTSPKFKVARTVLGERKRKEKERKKKGSII